MGVYSFSDVEIILSSNFATEEPRYLCELQSCIGKKKFTLPFSFFVKKYFKHFFLLCTQNDIWRLKRRKQRIWTIIFLLKSDISWSALALLHASWHVCNNETKKIRSFGQHGSKKLKLKRSKKKVPKEFCKEVLFRLKSRLKHRNWSQFFF